MTYSSKAKLVSAVAGAALVLGALAPAAHAATLAELQASLAALTAQIAAMQGTSVSSYTFTRDLTVGSQGADVTALQQALIAKGYSIPAGATGYFGAQTRSAVARWQAAAGVSPAAGYFGPKSRAAFAMTVTTGTTTTTTTTTTTGTTGGSTGTITTPGAEGILTVTAGPISNTVVYVGQKQVPILNVRANAQNSDIAVQRITLDLGASSNIFNKVYQTLYVMDQGRVLATVPLNSSTVVQSGSSNVVSLSGFNFVVPKGTYKDLTIAADLYSSIDSTYANSTSYTVTVPANGVRGVDGAGIDQFGPATAISQAIIVGRSLVDNSIANIALDSTNPQANTIPVTDTTNGTYLKLPVLTFSIGAQNDAVHLRSLTVNFVTSGTGSVTAAYLYQGSTQVSSAAVSITSGTGSAVFSNIQDGTAGATVAANTTLPYTVKVDVTGVTSGSLLVTASTAPTTSNLFNSQNGNVATVNGSASGNTQTVLGSGPAFTILGAPTITSQGTNQTGSTLATSSITAHFNVGVQAVGTAVYFGNQASAHPMFNFRVLKADGTPLTGVASSSGFIVPTGTGFITTGIGPNSFYLPQQQSGTLSDVTFTFQGKDTTGAVLTTGPYSVEVTAIHYSTNNGTSYANQTYMSGLSNWRTPAINVQ